MAGSGGAAGPAASRELLDVRQRPGLEDILLINSKCSSKKATTLQTVKMPRSSVLDRVQSFLPQMAQANDDLKRKMVTAPAHQFDIEHLDSEIEKVIEMNVAVVELSDSDTDEELLTSEDDSESDEDDSVTDECGLIIGWRHDLLNKPWNILVKRKDGNQRVRLPPLMAAQR